MRFIGDSDGSSAELLNSGNRSVATYGTIAVAPASRQYFITNLTQHKYFEGYQEVPDRRHDTIPWIVKTELGNEVSYVTSPMEEKIVHTYCWRSYRDVCEALGYSDEFFTKTEHLHSSNPSSPKVNADDMDDAGFQSRRDSFPTASQAQNDTSNAHRPASVDETPSNYPFSTSYLHDMSLRRKQLNQEDGDEDAAGRDPPTSRSVASQKTKRMIPDRSAKPLGDPDVSRRRRKPNEILKPADLPATSRGEPALSTQSAKRPLPESPTSAFQPTNASRRRQQPEERSTSEKTGPPQRTWKIRDRSIEKVVHERE